MILQKRIKMQGWVIGVLLTLFMFGSCSKDEISMLPSEEETLQPDVDDPIIAKPDTLEIKIGYDLNVSEEELVTATRSEFGSRDLIGVQIYHLSKLGQTCYAAGVFDDLDNLIFKFVKGNRYSIQMTYYPNAKDIVYNYPDGTYGAPFSYLYGLTSYKLNEPVYYSGLEGGWSGDIGPVLYWLMDPSYQPTEDRYVQSFKRGMTPRYLGEIEEITIEDDTPIVMPLQLCMMGITLNVDNFTEGTLTMNISGDLDWVVTPEDDHSIQFQSGSSEGIQLFYTTESGGKYLLATKQLPYKPGVNYVFNFSLTEREDGSISIQMPSNETLQDEEVSFD